VGVVVVAVRGSIPNEFFNSGGYGVFAIAVAALVVHLVDAPARVFTLVLASKPAVMTGRLSYAMYLWHLPLLLTINYYRPSMNHALKFALVLSLTMAISFLSYRVVELPFLRLKNRLPARA
jgi:peptidoglycan/LPS O-acetylase OafA/YrhL